MEKKIKTHKPAERDGKLQATASKSPLLPLVKHFTNEIIRAELCGAINIYTVMPIDKRGLFC
jgi:hypothetical protein